MKIFLYSLDSLTKKIYIYSIYWYIFIKNNTFYSFVLIQDSGISVHININFLIFGKPTESFQAGQRYSAWQVKIAVSTQHQQKKASCCRTETLRETDRERTKETSTLYRAIRHLTEVSRMTFGHLHMRTDAKVCHTLKMPSCSVMHYYIADKCRSHKYQFINL